MKIILSVALVAFEVVGTACTLRTDALYLAPPEVARASDGGVHLASDAATAAHALATRVPQSAASEEVRSTLPVEASPAEPRLDAGHVGGQGFDASVADARVAVMRSDAAV